ncbi:hypothetical protein BHE74_00005750 [Ensete ventricosum]|nr:hypothetical protein BHE74_00005750 [Ensete ventricosum]RZR89476.1 hypothetical protein BHM03_00017191 [Ensete ventricosum]
MLRVRTSYLNSASVAGDKLPSNEYGMIARGARLSVDVYRPIAKEARFYFIKVSLKQGIRNAANKSGSENKGKVVVGNTSYLWLVTQRIDLSFFTEKKLSESSRQQKNKERDNWL